jgi:hypothetical protein
VEYAAQPGEVAVARPDSGFLQRVFMWMFLGLCITGGVAALIGSNDALLTDITESPGIVIGVVIGQLVLVIALVAQISRQGLEGEAEGRAAIMGALSLYLD